MPNQSGTVTSMSVYISNPSPAPNNQYQVAIYSDSGGLPGSLIAQSQSATITADSWNTVSISANLSANTSYWLAYNANGLTTSNSVLKLDNGSTGQNQWKTQTFGTWPNPFGSSNSASYTGSIYATYTIGGSDTIPPAAPTGLRIN